VYRETTHGIQIDVVPEYVRERSSPEQYQYFFAYRIRITNLGEEPARLLSRHWIITDGNGTTHEVKGEGVVGEQPRIEPGQSHEYSSFCPLPTPTGNMRGSYRMVTDSGLSFDARIPLFFLRDASQFH
jgi:ApaG protein